MCIFVKDDAFSAEKGIFFLNWNAEVYINDVIKLLDINTRNLL